MISALVSFLKSQIGNNIFLEEPNDLQDEADRLAPPARDIEKLKAQIDDLTAFEGRLDDKEKALNYRAF